MFTKVLACMQPRGTVIAVRMHPVHQPATEESQLRHRRRVAMLSKKTCYNQRRWGADRSFELTRNANDGEATPISSYLDIPQILHVAVNSREKIAFGGADWIK